MKKRQKDGRVWGTGEEHRYTHRCEATEMIMAVKIISITNDSCFLGTTIL